MNKKTYIAIILTSTILILGIFSISYDRYARGFGYDMVILSLWILLVITSIFTIVTLMSIFLKRKNKDYKSYIPSFIASIGILFPFTPIFYDKPLAPAKFYSCYEGTMSVTGATFRIDNSFEIYSSSFGRTKWYIGNWNQSNDTLFLNFKGEKLSTLLGDTNIISDGYLFPITNNGNVEKGGKFYIGVCKGEN